MRSLGSGDATLRTGNRGPGTPIQSPALWAPFVVVGDLASAGHHAFLTRTTSAGPKFSVLHIWSQIQSDVTLWTRCLDHREGQLCCDAQRDRCVS